jgi:hypothetical protein
MALALMLVLVGLAVPTLLRTLTDTAHSPGLLPQ